MFDVLSNGTASRRDRHPASPVQNLDVAPSRIALAKLESQLVGEIDAHFRLKDRLDTVAGAVRLRGDRHAARAGPHHRQRAGGGDAPADPRPVELLRARGHGRPAGDGREDPLAAEPEPEAAGRRDHAPRQAHDAVARRAEGDRATSSATASSRPRSPRASASKRARPTRRSIFTFAPQSSGAYEYYRLCEEVIERV